MDPRVPILLGRQCEARWPGCLDSQAEAHGHYRYLVAQGYTDREAIQAALELVEIARDPYAFDG